MERTTTTTTTAGFTTLSVLQPPPPRASPPTPTPTSTPTSLLSASAVVDAPRSDKTKCVKKPRRSYYKSRIVYDFSVETLMKYTHLRQDEAAKAMGVAPITLKRICHRRQFRWPYRAIRAQARQAEKALVAAQTMLAMKWMATTAHDQKQHQANEDEDGNDDDDDDDDDEAWVAALHGKLPSYCVYAVPSHVPAMQLQSPPLQQRQPSNLPSLAMALGRRSPQVLPHTSQFPAKQRPHLACEQPQDEPAPTTTAASASGSTSNQLLPALNLLARASIYLTPTQAGEAMGNKKISEAPAAPLLSPVTTRFRLLPKIENNFPVVSRTINARSSS